MVYALPPINQLLQLAQNEQVEVLNHLFEPCSTLSAFIIKNVLPDQNFQSYKDFIETVRSKLLSFLHSEEGKANDISPDISKIIAAHPRLGPAKKTGTELSSHSSSEQKSLQGSEEESAKLLQLNEEYEATFPGLRYVVFVNGRSRELIMSNMKQRIQRGDITLERKEAFNAMCDIAWDRAKKLGAKL